MSRAAVSVAHWIQLVDKVSAGCEEDKSALWLKIREQWLQQLHDPLNSRLIWDSQREYEAAAAFYDAIAAAAACYTEQLLVAAGCGKPPVPYATIFFGSGGRKEMTPWSDQDHGLIWQEPEASSQDASTEYFMEWGKRYVDVLGRIGFPPCRGSVLASNLNWRGDERVWKARIHAWTNEGGWELTRSFTMALDMRAVYGDRKLIDRWRQSLNELRDERSSKVSKEMIANLMHRKPSHNSFGRLIRERYGEEAGTFDVKYRLYVPIAQMARATAWICDINEQALSTQERLVALQSVEVDNDLQSIVDDVLRHWPDVLTARWLSGGKRIDGYWQTTGMVEPERFPSELKHSLRCAAHVSTRWLRWLERRTST